MSADQDSRASGSEFGRIARRGALFFLLLLAIILATGIALSLSGRGEIGAWLRGLRDFLAIALLLELTLLVMASIAFFWRLYRFVDELAAELSAIGGDARETVQLARESVLQLRREILQPLLDLRAMILEIRGVLLAWAGIKQSARENAPHQPEADSS